MPGRFSMEISILPGAVPLGCHIDRRAKQAVVGVQLAQPGGLAGGDQPR